MSAPQDGIEIVMPRMGLTMESGVFLKWLKQTGEPVRNGEPLFEIETDKSIVQVEAMDEGLLSQTLAVPGETYPVGAVLGYLTRSEGGLTSTPDQNKQNRPLPSVPQMETATPIYPPPSAKVKASPAARRLARQFGVDLAQIQGTGPAGRIVAWNVRAVAEQPQPIITPPLQTRVSPLAQRIAADLGVDLRQVKGSGPGGSITRQDVEAAYQRQQQPAQPVPETAVEEPILEPLTPIQRRMAERMSQSFGSAPHFYLQAEVDGRNLVALRQSLLQPLENRYGIHLTYTDLLIYFTARLLPRHPLVMAQWSEKGLAKFSQVHLGIAVDTEQGLFVPVLRNADQLGLVEISRRRADLTERARQGKLLPQDYEQGVFTLTNLGMLRVDVFQAILNPPQAAILAVGRIKERPMIENHEVIVAPMFTLSLSADHRVLDGAKAARFLSELVEWLENPALSMA